MLLLALLPAALAWDSASTTASAGGLSLTGLDGAALHSHGGPAARLGHADFHVRWQGTAPIALTVTRVRFLSSHGCETSPTEVRSEPRFGGLFSSSLGMTESVASLSLDPGAELDLTVGFTSVEAYYSWCDRFAFQVDFSAATPAGDIALRVVAETNVTREEPLREDRLGE